MSGLVVGELFSGIGGLGLGLERAGMELRWHAEIDSYCIAVHEKHWPGLPNLGDVTKVDWSNVERVDLVCGGFPCQDISSGRTANARQGLHGEQSGLYWALSEAVAALRPRFVVVENSPEWRRWVPPVRSDLRGRGYASVSFLVPAGSRGAPHRRPRCFVVADSYGEGESLRALHAEMAGVRALPVGSGHWRTSTSGGLRVDDGVPAGMDRCRVLGNAVVPQVAEFIGSQLLASLSGESMGEKT